MEKNGAEDEDLAAAFAAVFAFIKTEEEAQKNAVPSKNSKSLSPWLLACRLKASGRSAADFVSASELNAASCRLSSMLRRASLPSAILLLLSFSLPVSALERIQFDPDAAALQQKPSVPESQRGREPLCPVAPSISVREAADFAKTLAPPKNIEQAALQLKSNRSLPTPSVSVPAAATEKISPARSAGADSVALPDGGCAHSMLRVALSSSATAVEIICPDGAGLYDEATEKLVAELPAQSLWRVSLEGADLNSRLSFAGKIGNFAASKTLVASGTGNSEHAAYSRNFHARSPGGFMSQPELISSASPVFSMPVKPPFSPAVQSGARKLSPVSFQSSIVPSGTSGKPTPLVVNGYILRPRGSEGLIACAGKLYRGSLLLKPKNSEPASFVVVNLIDLEDYLLSVVPSEMPSEWSMEALKAQAIAARSYAVANSGKHQSEGYDLKASTEDQVYLGVQTESAASNRAVAETRGQVLKHCGKVVSAFFHSAGGGHTGESEHVWGGRLPYLRSVPDFDDQSPHFNWNRAIPVTQIEETLRKQGRDIGGLLGIFPLEKSPSQRVTFAMLAGTLQTVMVSGEELRKILGLPSTVFNIGAGLDSYLVAGRGFGHGLGMSQWGAKYLSEQGYNAAQILSYYYKDVSIDQL